MEPPATHPLDLRLIEYFVVLAEELNFSRTATRLHISQSSLSEKIKVLEADVGVRLFERSKHRVTLTAAGVALLESASPLLHAAAQAVDTARRASTPSEETLVIAATWGLRLAHFVFAFRKDHPQLEVVLHESLSAEAEDALAAGAADVAFLRGGIGAHPDIEHAVVARERLVVWLPKEHRAAAYDRVPLQALTDKLLIWPRVRSPQLYDQVLQMCRERGFQPRVEEIDTQSFHPMIAAVAAGCGVCFGLDTLAHSFEGEGAVWRPISPPEPEIDVIMAWRNATSNAWVSRFVQRVPRLG